MEVALRDLGKLAPLAIALGVVGIALAWMLQRQMALGTWLFALFLFGHGLVHIMFVVSPAVDPAKPEADFLFDSSRSWLVTNHVLEAGLVKGVVILLVAAVMVGYSLTALATVGLIVPASWWSGLLVASTLASLVLMVIGLSPTLALGIAIDVVLLWVAVAAVWSPTGAAAF
jgi:hypothetical protein